MTKPTGVGRGGRRSGAGRKPKHDIREKAIDKAVASAEDDIRDAQARTASDLVAKAYATLEDVMDNSPFPAPRVTAARAVLELAKEEGAGAKQGKKAIRQAAADQATGSGGRFDVRSGPRLAVSNT